MTASLYLRQSDFHALGRTCVYLLTGIHPSDIQSNISNWRQSTRYPISDSLVKLINHLMASEWSRRPKNAKVILGRLTLIRLEYKIHRLLRRLWLSGRRMLRRFWLIAGLVLVSGLIGAAIASYILAPTVCDSVTNDYLSCGEEILANISAFPEKSTGVQQLKDGKYDQAVALLNTAWEKSKTDNNKPDSETLIYLNNARINHKLNKETIQKNQVYTIAVVAPLSDNTPDKQIYNQGLEILRGVAQAQEEAIQKKIYLKVLIADDYNQNDHAKQIAEKLVKKTDILAVVGHFSSDSTKAALPIYQNSGLVLVSPSSTSVNIKSNFFFRTVPSDEIAGGTLAKYLNNERKNKVAVLWSQDSDYSQSLKEKFSNLFSFLGNVVVEDSQEFHLSNQKFNSSVALDKAEKQEATAIALFPSRTAADSVDKALEIIKSDKHRDLIMVAGDSLSIERVLKEAGEKAVGRRLVLAIPWHRLSSPNPNFPELARNLWQAVDVSWRTATSYDATQVLIEAMKKQPSRKGVQQVLSRNKFQVEGATGDIKFKESDRANAQSTLVTVVPYCSPASGYYFVPTDYLPRLPNQSNGVKCFPLNPNQ